MSIGKAEAKEGAGTRIGRPIFDPYRSAQFTLRIDDKQVFSIGRKRKDGGECERETKLAKAPRKTSFIAV